MPDNKYHFRNGYMISEDICFEIMLKRDSIETVRI